LVNLLRTLFVKEVQIQQLMYKVIIQPAQKFGFYQVILMQQQQRFYFIKWWKDISCEEYEEEAAFLKLTDLIEKHNIKSADIYDWSGDGFDVADVKKAS
jgi:hypothetical protein